MCVHCVCLSVCNEEGGCGAPMCAFMYIYIYKFQCVWLSDTAAPFTEEQESTGRDMQPSIQQIV